MKGNLSEPKRVLVCTRENEMAAELRNALDRQSVTISTEVCQDVREAMGRVRDCTTDLVFCDTSQNLNALLRATLGIPRRIPVVVVSRHPEVRQWLDAIEAGAADYCAAPFEVAQLSWILANNLTALRAA